MHRLLSAAEIGVILRNLLNAIAVRSQKSEKSVKSVVEILVKFVRFVFRKKKGVAYEEFKILGCAVEDYSSSHHGSRHGADDYVMYGAWPILSLPTKNAPSHCVPHSYL